MKAIDYIIQYEQGDYSCLKNRPWLMYLALSKHQNVNYERIESLEDLSENIVLNYVKSTFEILNRYELNDSLFYLLEETLKWSEVAKCGLKHHRNKWNDLGYNLQVHNIGSAQIYEAESDDYNPIVRVLIETHGLIGQFVRGEVPLSHSNRLLSLINEDVLTADKLIDLLLALNHCIIGGVSEALWEAVKEETYKAIVDLIEGHILPVPVKERLRLLRQTAIKNGEDFDSNYNKMISEISLLNIGLEWLSDLFLDKQIWYFEAALNDFNLQEVFKILLILYTKTDMSEIKHISFEGFMKSIYYDYKGKKKVNLYKKRMIQKYLSDLNFESILNHKVTENSHLSICINTIEQTPDTAFFEVEFTIQAGKLIEFCVEAEKSSLDYERAIVLLYDYFDLRKDKYDRFHNEESYLEMMNSTIDYKRVILDYIVGHKVIDIGPGGGALMDLIVDHRPDIQVTGIDISKNVIESLLKRKVQEKKQWNVQYGDALNLSHDCEPGSVDTIIFCSIIHELFSYIEYDGKCFNKAVIGHTLRSAIEVLSKGGRIIIRDGIMTQPKDLKRHIKFNGSDGMEFLERYANDFKGRDIQYKIIGHHMVEMNVNDAMEFLYTYTWGEDSYAHEINEQFGYFTPSEYKEFIHDTIGDLAEIVVFKHYLQEGYTTALEPKINFYDENGHSCSLPDSTCLIVIEKK